MSLWRMVWTSLCGRLLANTLTALSVALGVSLILATVLLTRGMRAGLLAGTSEYPLLVGAKSSPTQLVLGTLLRLDVATPNILYSVYEHLRDDARVERAVPMALGDAYQGWRYVATTSAYFAPAPWRRTQVTLASGRFWKDEPPAPPSYAALLGAEVSQRTGLGLGDLFYEGEEMAERPLHVRGILQPTHSADDRTIFISLGTYWDMNEVSRAVPVKPLTSVLIRPKRLADLPQLHRELNVHPETQAAIPSAVLLTLLNVLGVVEDVMDLVLGAIVLIVALSLCVALYNAMLARRREMATMRALGARRLTVLLLVLLEASALAGVGGLLGLVGGHALAALGAQILAHRGGLVLPPAAISLLHPLLLGAATLLGAGAGLVPALLAYRTEVAEHLLPLS